MSKYVVRFNLRGEEAHQEFDNKEYAQEFYEWAKNKAPKDEMKGVEPPTKINN